MSFMNDAMSNAFRGIVSKQRRRYKEDGYDLDLTYITPRIIAMGFPAQNLEGVYRNHIADVSKFLEQKHKDHYKVYNLCCERSYDESVFHNRVRRFYFEDHNPPPFSEIKPLCDDISQWLKENPQNVVAVHCKAGKGRTGVMICCYLVHSKLKLSAKDALDFYDDKRTLDKKGVTIPSQRRYVEYYANLVNNGFKYNPPLVQLKEVRLSRSPLGNINSELRLEVSAPNQKKYYTQPVELRKGSESITLHVKEEDSRPFKGDVQIELKRISKFRKEKVFSAWLNTHFIFEEGRKISNGYSSVITINSNRKSHVRQSVSNSGNSNSTSTDISCTYSDDPILKPCVVTNADVVTNLRKFELDKVNKDIHNKLFPEDFEVELHWIVKHSSDQSGRSSLKLNVGGCHSSTRTSSGASSETEEDGDDDNSSDWDSAEDVEVLF